MITRSFSKKSEVLGWVDHSASKEDFFLFIYKLTMQNIEEFCFVKHCKEGASVVTYFLAPHARDGVYLFWTEYKSLAHICWKIDKSKEEKSVFRTLFQLFSALFILPLCCRNR